MDTKTDSWPLIPLLLVKKTSDCSLLFHCHNAVFTCHGTWIKNYKLWKNNCQIDDTVIMFITPFFSVRHAVKIILHPRFTDWLICQGTARMGLLQNRQWDGSHRSQKSCSLTVPEQGEQGKLVTTRATTKNPEIIRQLQGNINLSSPVCKSRKDLTTGQVRSLSLNGAPGPMDADLGGWMPGEAGQGNEGFKSFPCFRQVYENSFWSPMSSVQQTEPHHHQKKSSLPIVICYNKPCIQVLLFYSPWDAYSECKMKREHFTVVSKVRGSGPISFNINT